MIRERILARFRAICFFTHFAECQIGGWSSQSLLYFSNSNSRDSASVNSYSFLTMPHLSLFAWLFSQPCSYLCLRYSTAPRSASSLLRKACTDIFSPIPYRHIPFMVSNTIAPASASGLEVIFFKVGHSPAPSCALRSSISRIRQKIATLRLCSDNFQSEQTSQPFLIIVFCLLQAA